MANGKFARHGFHFDTPLPLKSFHKAKRNPNILILQSIPKNRIFKYLNLIFSWTTVLLFQKFLYVSSAPSIAFKWGSLTKSKDLETFYTTVTKVKKNPTCFGGLGFNHFTYFAVLKLRSDNELEGPSARRKTFILGPQLTGGSSRTRTPSHRGRAEAKR